MVKIFISLGRILKVLIIRDIESGFINKNVFL